MVHTMSRYMHMYKVGIKIFTTGSQGSMLCSQLSAIFANFRHKNGVFLKNQCYDPIFANSSCNLGVKHHILTTLKILTSSLILCTQLGMYFQGKNLDRMPNV
jgi:hypothetical protein